MIGKDKLPKNYVGDFHKDWKGEEITIESKDHFEQLLKEGYEVLEHTFEYVKDLGTKVTLLMSNNDKQLIANANTIAEHVMQCQYLYDFDKKKIAFTWVPNTSVYWDFEKTVVDILYGNYTKPITTKTIDSKNKNKIFSAFSEWLKSEQKLQNTLERFSIFDNVCLIKEKSGEVIIDILPKKKLSLDDIHKIHNDSKSYDQCISLSFFCFSKQLSKMNDLKDDGLFGIICYDLKNEETLCMNIKSMISFYMRRKIKGDNFFSIVFELFNKAIDKNLNFFSNMPFPINTRWYTPLPWIIFANLSKSMPNSSLISPLKITIPQFFTFGYHPGIMNKGNFAFNRFSNEQNGRAVCVLYFNHSESQIPYNLRFDQSKGEPLVHLDFAFSEIKREVKLIEHYPLDLEKVVEFNRDLFLAIMMAGLFDSYFTTIIKSGLQGIEELIKKNPAFLYVVKLIWRLDTAIIWLNDNKECYPLLNKLYKEETLSEHEQSLVKKMYESKIEIITPPEDNKPYGISMYGFMILQRYQREMTDIVM